jgi:hypothetical protein
MYSLGKGIRSLFGYNILQIISRYGVYGVYLGYLGIIERRLDFTHT